MNPLQLLSCGSDSKESACNVRDLGLIPGSGRSPGEGNGSPLQYSCLENSLDRRTIRLQVREVAKSRTRLSDYTFTFQLNTKVIPVFILSSYPSTSQYLVLECMNKGVSLLFPLRNVSDPPCFPTCGRGLFPAFPVQSVPKPTTQHCSCLGLCCCC